MPSWKIVKEQDYYGLLLTGFVKTGPDEFHQFANVSYGDDTIGNSYVPVKKVEQWVLEPKYQEIRSTHGSYYIVNSNGKLGIYYIHKREYPLESYDFESGYSTGKVNESFYDTYPDPKTDTALVTKSKIPFIVLGGFILSPSYEKIEFEKFFDGFCFHVIAQKNNKTIHGLLRGNIGNWLVEPNYNVIWSIGGSVNAIILRLNQKYELRNKNGKILFVTENWKEIRGQIGMNYSNTSSSMSVELDTVEKEIEKEASNIERIPEPKEKEELYLEKNPKQIEKNKEQSDEKKPAQKSRWFHF
jgi:hypothetical protein